MGGIRKAPLFTPASLWIEVDSDWQAGFRIRFPAAMPNMGLGMSCPHEG
jgi:hypothetical protein